MTATTLDKIQVGDQAIITDFTATEVHFRRKLLAFGIMPGAQIKVIRHAPLGDPIQIQVRGTSVALRKHEAETIKARQLI